VSHTAYIALGSNLEQPEEQVRRAFREIDALAQTRVTARSSLYRSAPWGYAGQPDFINAVVEIRTELSAPALLRELLRIELRHARERSFPNAPRTLDLDIALYGDAQIDEPGLRIPHPRLHERAFVLMPLVEIAPQALVPGRGTAEQLLAGCSHTGIQKLSDATGEQQE
jgi:2-amino-4-hydroxy-6-hydroxymethyldihydropteridine diphosphokinase